MQLGIVLDNRTKDCGKGVGLELGKMMVWFPMELCNKRLHLAVGQRTGVERWDVPLARYWHSLERSCAARDCTWHRKRTVTKG